MGQAAGGDAGGDRGNGRGRGAKVNQPELITVGLIFASEIDGGETGRGWSRLVGYGRADWLGVEAGGKGEYLSPTTGH